ncbi:MAG: hypothetical protein WBL68_03120 [Nitrososphaeraceae archaeon]
MGSNPIPSIVALVRIPDIRNTGTGQKPKVLLEIQHRTFQFRFKESYERHLQPTKEIIGLD